MTEEEQQIVNCWEKHWIYRYQESKARFPNQLSWVLALTMYLGKLGLA